MNFTVDDTTKKGIVQYFRKHKNYSYSEDFFLNILENDQSKEFDIYYSVIGLREVGTSNSIESLKKMVHYPKDDIRDCALLTIAQLLGKNGTQYFIDCLNNQKTRSKTFVVWAMVEIGDEKSIESLSAYFKKIAKKSSQKMSQKRVEEIVLMLEFFDKYYHENLTVRELFMSHQFLTSLIDDRNKNMVKKIIIKNLTTCST